MEHRHAESADALARCARVFRRAPRAHRTSHAGVLLSVCSLFTRDHTHGVSLRRCAPNAAAAPYSGRVAEGKSASIRPAFKIVRAAFAVGSEREP